MLNKPINQKLQPDWMLAYTSQFTNGRKMRLFAESESFAILKSPGASGYVKVGSRSQYYPTEYLLIPKHMKKWATQEVVWTGRLTKEGKAKVLAALNSKEKSK